MREIKFRYIYQRKEDPNLPEFSLQIADPRDSTWTLEQISEGEPDNYISVCLSSSWKVIAINQYTGLKDKNGKELYEGDIYELKIGSKVYYRGYIRNLDTYSGFGHETIKTERVHLYKYGPGGNKFEIIGNIYENPELLNK